MDCIKLFYIFCKDATLLILLMQIVFASLARSKKQGTYNTKRIVPFFNQNK